MEVTETRSEGLARELRVVVPAQTLEERLTAYLDDLRAKVRLKGFRPGKVPVSHLRRMYGRSAMAEVINEVMNETVKDTVSKRDETPAVEPDIDLDEAPMKDVVEGNADLAFAIKYEVLPQIEVSGLESITVERPVYVVPDEEVEGEIARIADANRSSSPVERPADRGDVVTVDFAGRIGGVPFDGGSGEGVEIELGSERFIPGFEEQLVGASAGEARTVTVRFPEDYSVAHLAGEEAVFDVTVKTVSAPDAAAVDDALAERLGLGSLEELRNAVRGQLENLYGRASRHKVKRALLDALDERFGFELPQKLVDTEFDTIWREVAADMERRGETFDADGERSEAAVREEYRRIAERRVRLGLLLSEVGTNASIEVTDEEAERALYERVRQFPGREREVFEAYRKNPQALASLRAPIFEDKVVDYLLELVSVTDKPVSKDDLLAPDPDEEALRGGADGHDHHHDHDHDHDHSHDHGHDHSHDHDHDHSPQDR